MKTKTVEYTGLKAYKDFLFSVMDSKGKKKDLNKLKADFNQLIFYIKKIKPSDIYEAKLWLFDSLKKARSNFIISKFDYFNLFISTKWKYLINIYPIVLKNNLRTFYVSLLTLISPKLNTRVFYKRRLKKAINLEKPQTFNERVQWLKLNYLYPNELVTRCADKVLVRDYIKEMGCEEILTDVIAVYDRVSEIDFSKLPKKFVLKWNFGSGYNIICHDKEKLNISITKRLLKKWGRTKFHLHNSELQYKDIKKRIICEKFIDAPENKVPEDYKFYCFNGKAEYVLVCCEREKGKPKLYFIDRNWQLTDLRKNYEDKKISDIKKPANIEEMFNYADKLSKDFPFVRVDLYNSSGKIYFGELTFTPAAGLSEDYTEKGERILGDKIPLETIKKVSDLSE